MIQSIGKKMKASYSTPATETASVISLPSTAKQGQLNAVLSGNTKTNVAVATWATDLAGWTSADDSIDAATYYKLAKVSSTTGERDVSSQIIVTKNYLVTAYGVNASDTAGAKFDIINGTGGASIVASTTLTATQSSRVGLIFQASDLTGKVPYLQMSHIGSGSVKFYQFFIQEITATEYALGLAACMVIYPYRTAGTKSTFQYGGRGTLTSKNVATVSSVNITGVDGEFSQYIPITLLQANMDFYAYIHAVITAGTIAIYWYDANKVMIEWQSMVAGDGGVFTRQVTASLVASQVKYVRFKQVTSTSNPYIISNIDIRQSEMPTTYDAHTDTQAYIPPSTNSLISVGDVKDEVNFVTGVRTQKNEIASIATTVYASLDKTTYTEVDVIKTTAFALAKAGTAAVDGFTTYYNSAGTVLTEIAAANIDEAGSVGKYYYHTDKTVWIFVTPDTYADIAAARTGLGTSTLNYQLAQEIYSEIEGMGQLMSEPSGSFVWEPAPKFKAKPVTGVITIPSGYANIVSVESVRKIVPNIDGTLEYFPVVPSTFDGTTITLPAVYDDTKFYEVVYLYDSALTTLPDITYSFPTNVRGEIDSIGDMGKETAMSLADFMSYQNAVNLEFDLRITALEP